MENPALFVRISTPDGHFAMPAAIAARDKSLKVIADRPASDGLGGVEQPKPRRRKSAARTRRASKGAVTPPIPEANVSADIPEESE